MQIRKTKELCKNIEKYGGLWKSFEEIARNLSSLKDTKEITEALKCQLKFRQKVLLESSIVDNNLFHFSCKKIIFFKFEVKRKSWKYYM